MQISEITGKGRLLQSQLFLQLEGIEHYSSIKETTGADKEVWLPKQVHGTAIATLDNVLPQEDTVEADAVICNIPGQWIGVRTADCVPILVYDTTNKVVAAIHAGWRGTVKHIARQVIEAMLQKYSSQSHNLYAMVGPSISAEAFEVGDEVVEEFKKAQRAECIIHYPNQKPHVDLWQSNVMDLLEAGIELDHIDCTPICTMQNTDILYSARKEGIQTGRNVTAIRIKP